jgi:hypothetical protein
VNKTLEKILLDFINVRSIITLGAFGLAYYMILTEKSVPDFLIGFVNLLQGFWFGQKYSQIKEKGEIIP